MKLSPLPTTLHRAVAYSQTISRDPLLLTKALALIWVSFAMALTESLTLLSQAIFATPLSLSQPPPQEEQQLLTRKSSALAMEALCALAKCFTQSCSTR
jgi:hypothetical protein